MQTLTDVYPFNLAKDVFDSETDALKIYVPGLYQALATLAEREADILRRRYQEKMTLKAIGQIYEVGQEQIRQIEAKAIRKLRHPTRVNMFKAVPLTEMQELTTEHQKMSRAYDLLARAFETAVNKPEPGIIANLTELAMTIATKLEDLDFSTRTYNCLRRARMNTLGDIVCKTANEIAKIRNLGRKSFDEIVMTLEKYGLSLEGSHDNQNNIS